MGSNSGSLTLQKREDRRLLRSAGMVVDIYPDSSQFFASLVLKNPDCTLLDLQMPGLNACGVTVREQLRESQRDGNNASRFCNFSREIRSITSAQRIDFQ